MTTLTSIVDKASELVASLTALIDSDVGQALPAAAEELGIKETFEQGVKLLADLLGKLETAIVKLEPTVEQIDAFVGLQGLLEPLIGALGRMLASAGATLDLLTSGAALEGTISRGVVYAERAFALVGTLDIRVEAFTHLCEQLGTLRSEVLKLAGGGP